MFVVELELYVSNDVYVAKHMYYVSNIPPYDVVSHLHPSHNSITVSHATPTPLLMRR